MEIENKLDEDFIFYLGFLSPFLKKLTNPEVKNKCELWLTKLCGEKNEGIDRKRCRNIYLSQLLICMQENKLCEQFLYPPNEVDIGNAYEIFELQPLDEKKPAWLKEHNYEPDMEGMKARKGRTYLATRTLPDGQGAMAYIALSMGEAGAEWLGAGEGLDKHLEEKFQTDVADAEMKAILAHRKSPAEREKVVTYYKVILGNIEDELDEKISSAQNTGINGLLDQLAEDLQSKNEFEQLAAMDENARRIELLIILHDRIKARIKKTIERVDALDDIEQKVLTKSFFETSALEQDRTTLPANMWEQAINKAPAKKHIDKLQTMYPLSLIEKFFYLLANYKEVIAVRMQRRYENIVTQMKKEVRREGEKGNKIMAEAKRNYDDVLDVLKVVKEAYNKKMEREKKNKDKLGSSESEHSKLYEGMRAALCDTQKSVEEEAARGRLLATQINVVNEQAEMAREVNEDSFRKVEDANLAIMRNIRRLNLAIKQHQDRITQIEANTERQKEGGGGHFYAGFM